MLSTLKLGATGNRDSRLIRGYLQKMNKNVRIPYTQDFTVTNVIDEKNCSCTPALVECEDFDLDLTVLFEDFFSVFISIEGIHQNQRDISPIGFVQVLQSEVRVL